MKKFVFILVFQLAFKAAFTKEVRKCETAGQFSEIQFEVRHKIYEADWASDAQRPPVEWLQFFSASFAYSFCKLSSSSTDAFSISTNNYSEIYNHYLKKGFDLAGRNKVLIFPFDSVPIFFDVDLGSFPLALYWTAESSEIINFAMSNLDFYEVYRDRADVFYEGLLTDEQEKVLNDAMKRLTEDFWGVNNLILVDHFFWNSKTTTELDRKVTLVHEIRHQYDHHKNPKLFHDEKTVPRHWGETYPPSKSYLKAKTQNLSDETESFIDDIVSKFLGSKKPELEENRPAGYSIPSQERYSQILEEVFVKFQKYFDDEIEKLALDEESIFLKNQGKDCEQIASEYNRFYSNYIQRNSEGEYFFAPPFPGEADHIRKNCLKLKTKLPE